jgi:hypothetical protein
MIMVSLLRRFFDLIWERIALQWVVTASACMLAIWMQFEYRVPGPFVFVLLPAVGFALVVLNLFLWADYFLKELHRLDTVWSPVRVFLGRIETVIGVLVRVFVYSSLLLYVNGKLDSSKPLYRAAEVVADARIWNPDLPFSYSWVAVRYRDEPSQTVKVLLKDNEQSQLWGAEPVSVTEGQGALGIHYVTAVEQDWHWYGHEILKISPAAAQAWRKLIIFDLTHGRIDEGAITAEKYLKLYPQDYEMASEVAYRIFITGNALKAVPFADHAATQHPTYDAYQSLGTYLSYSGNWERAAEVLENSIELSPDDWEAHYHLGYVYKDWTKYEKSLEAFGRALDLNPNQPEVEIEIVNVKQLLADARAFRRSKEKR